MNKVNNMLTVSEMAHIQRISKQALIHYDKIGLFKPAIVDEHGYRFYNITQIPLLREICFLKSIGVKLEIIKEHIQNRTPKNTIELLEAHEIGIKEAINALIQKQKYIEQRLNIYRNAAEFEQDVNKPTIEYFPERKAVFFPWGQVEMTRPVLHLTLMKTWDVLKSHGMPPSNGWGAIIRKEHLFQKDPLTGAGAYTNLPFEAEKIENVVIFPEGEYACMCKYGMPYETDHIFMLTKWIGENGYEIIGDVVDECFLDTTFYDKGRIVDFCQLQIPIRKIK